VIVREVKLKLTKKQQGQIDFNLSQLRSVWNTLLVKQFISLEQNRRLITEFDLIKELSGHGKKAGINQDVLAEMVKNVYRACAQWCYEKVRKKPKFKSIRNKVNSLVYGQASKLRAPNDRRVRVPSIGLVRCSKNLLPDGKIVGGALVKRATGYFFQYRIRAEPNLKKTVTLTGKNLGIDPGFRSLLSTSDNEGSQEKIGNPNEFRKKEVRIAQAQRGKNKKLVARLQRKVTNQKIDRNHKISSNIVRENDRVTVSADSFKAMQRHFGKSILNAGIGQLLLMIAYKMQSCGKGYKEVSASYTTHVWARTSRQELFSTAKK